MRLVFTFFTYYTLLLNWDLFSSLLRCYLKFETFSFLLKFYFKSDLFYLFYWFRFHFKNLALFYFFVLLIWNPVLTTYCDWYVRLWDEKKVVRQNFHEQRMHQHLFLRRVSVDKITCTHNICFNPTLLILAVTIQLSLPDYKASACFVLFGFICLN